MVSSVVSSHVYSLKYQTAPEIDAITCMPNTSTLNEKHSDRRDIIPGKYYGGLKVWSCAPYLAQFLLEHETEYRPIFSKTDSHKKSCSTVVAEVGCGHALPGLAALCLGASHVILQDYNAEVLDACTGPNVAATVNSNPHFFATFSDTQPSKLSYPSVKLVHGDWVDFRCDDHCDKCDVILGSDVTFDVEACQKLVCLLQRWLKPDGFALIASKEYYFGTNGGRLEFVAIASQHGIKVEILDELKDGGSMNRVILKVFAGPSLIND